ncbi:DNA mismatch repair protein MutS [Salinarchaeum laminariae]|uniref:DNA mismatch repair protein MutS n=1 Tax=Salinarchaeum laminariae TaxID=869888 RepID=UPI0020C0940D|nr:DNA mismatch repair protein MutS [Salinarchaeum laminariae]
MDAAEGIVGEFATLKEESGADVLAMQVGDFYEFFGEDAELVCRELDLKQTSKSSGGESYAMAGVPLSELTPYLQALVERGYRVAVADQRDEDGDHSRELTRVVSPGTLLSTTDADARYLATVVEETDRYGVALADVTTGRFYVTGVGGDLGDLLAELARFDPVEVLPGPDLREDDDAIATLRNDLDATLTLHEAEAFAPGAAAHRLREQFGDGAVESVGLEQAAPAVQAAGATLDYVETTGAGVLASFTRLQRYRDREHVALDATTQRNLELTETMQGDRQGSLLARIDQTVTSPGRRRLGEWLARPRRDRESIETRLDSVDALGGAALARERLREELSEAADLARLASRATHGSADAADLIGVRDALAVLPAAEAVISDDETLADSPLPAILQRPDREAAADLRAELDAALAEEPPASISEGGLIARGYDDELDEVVERHEAALEWIDGLDDRVSDELGLTHVTVDRNATDGYYVQVGSSEADQVPERFRQIKSLKNHDRFVTEELEEREREILRLEDERAELEREIFEEVRATVASEAALLQDAGRAIATADALASLATHAAEQGWVRPELGPAGGPVEIERGRHPVVETTTAFVPNDASLGDDRRFVIVTGPNMSGKSTYMRQTALIVLLAQVGSFVPADAAEIGLVDGIYTRVGALDELAQGRSTFMVEMQELANILHSATEESLVILDEVGRGTATYDGISIAWAATEYLHNEIGAKTLFATHYHELTTLADHLDRVANVHVAAEETDGEVTFLRTVREGPTDRSYGIHVADLAGVPEPVVDRSDDVLDRLRKEQAIEARGSGGSGGQDGEPQQVVFDVGSGELKTASADGGMGTQRTRESTTESSDDAGDQLDPETEAVLEELTDLDVNETPPVELLGKVQEWQESLDEE